MCANALRAGCLSVAFFAVTIHAMPPIYQVVEYDATQVQTIHRSYTSGLIGDAFNSVGTQVVNLVGSVAFECTKRNFKCLNTTHDRYFEKCIPASMAMEYSVDAPEFSEEAYSPYTLIYGTAAMGAAATGILSLCRRVPVKLKNCLYAFGLTAMYTAGVFYTFETFTDNRDPAVLFAQGLISGGTVFIALRFAK